MTNREKLIELIGQVQYLGGLELALADHLLANGVTFQKWIPVSERLPREYKAVIAWTEYHEIGEAQYNGKHFEWLDDEGDYDHAHVTHWMPLPEPPKEDVKKLWQTDLIR